jgi:hypothetical protein
MGLDVVGKKLLTFKRMDSVRRALMIEAFAWLAIARLALLIFPFRHVAKHLGDLAPPAESARARPMVSSRNDDTKLAEDIGWAVRRSAGYAPFKAVCLQQAIAAKVMLRRRGVQSALHFGVARANPPKNGLEAHAWLDAAGAKVTGYPVSNIFTEIACFL